MPHLPDFPKQPSVFSQTIIFVKAPKGKLQSLKTIASVVAILQQLAQNSDHEFIR